MYYTHPTPSRLTAKFAPIRLIWSCSAGQGPGHVLISVGLSDLNHLLPSHLVLSANGIDQDVCGLIPVGLILTNRGRNRKNWGEQKSIFCKQVPSVTQIDINLAVIVAARKVQIARNWLDINHNRPGSVGLHQNAPYFLSVCLGRGAVLPSSVLSWPGQTCLFISWILVFFSFLHFWLAQELDISLSGGRTSVFRTLRTIWIFRRLRPDRDIRLQRLLRPVFFFLCFVF